MLPLAELELRISLLPPISRGAHLDGPTLQAERLVELWRRPASISCHDTLRSSGIRSENDGNVQRVAAMFLGHRRAQDRSVTAFTSSSRNASASDT